jgi:hypothetical protein
MLPLRVWFLPYDRDMFLVVDDDNVETAFCHLII